MNPKIRRLPIMRRVTDTLDEILNQNVSVSGSSAEILPQKPDNSDIQVTFED